MLSSFEEKQLYVDFLSSDDPHGLIQSETSEMKIVGMDWNEGTKKCRSFFLCLHLEILIHLFPIQGEKDHFFPW